MMGSHYCHNEVVFPVNMTFVQTGIQVSSCYGIFHVSNLTENQSTTDISILMGDRNTFGQFMLNKTDHNDH